MSSRDAAAAAAGTASSSSVRRASAAGVVLLQQLAEVQASFQRMQAEAQLNNQQIILSTQPAIPAQKVPLGRSESSVLSSSSSSSSSSSVRAFDARRRELSSLTLTLIMGLRMEQIRRLRDAFEQQGGVVSVSQFVAIMAATLQLQGDAALQRQLQAKPDLLVRSLVELFDSMDLDGDGELEFEELLTTVVHMGLAATEHLLLTPISPYHAGPHYMVSMQQVERDIRFITERDTIMIIDSSPFAARFFEPGMNHCFAVHMPISSALSVEYVAGLKLEAAHESYLFSRGGGADAASSGTKGAAAYRGGVRDRSRPSSSSGPSSRSDGHGSMGSMWERLSHQSLTKPMRMENGQPVIQTGGSNGNSNKGSPNGRATDNDNGKTKNKEANSQLFSQFTAKPYFSFGPTPSSTFSSNSSSSASSSTSPSSSSSVLLTKRSPVVLIQEDYLISSTSQHLQLWGGFPTGPAFLCDSKRIRSSYACIKWCPQLQRLFCGDVQGTIDVWRIVAPPASQAQHPHQQLKPALLKERELVGHTDIITGLASISSMGFLLSSSLDASVRMFDLQAGVEKNRFIGHRAGVVGLAYSDEYRFLLSAGSDHQVCVWSPFADKQVFTLRGHTAPLIGVQFVPGTPQIVSADSSGWMRIWDARNFACTQTFFTMANITGFSACGHRHKRIVVVGKGHELQVYEQEGGPFLKRKKEEPIFAALYSPFTMTMLTANKYDVKVWDGLSGSLSRVYRGLAESDLTAVCLDARQRKLFVGDQKGKIRVYNYITGAYMKSMTPHEQEIISLTYCGSRRLLVSATDRSVFVHDERPIEECILHLSVYSEPGCEYLLVCASERLSCLACALSNGRVEVWNLDQSMRDVPIQGQHGDVITAMAFIDEQQLLLSADESGTIKAWFVRPSRWKGQLAFQLQTPPKASPFAQNNATLPNIQTKTNSINDDPIKQVQPLTNVWGISCMAFHSASQRLFCGHRDGQIAVWDLGPLLTFLQSIAQDHTTNWFELPNTPPPPKHRQIMQPSHTHTPQTLANTRSLSSSPLPLLSRSPSRQLRSPPSASPVASTSASTVGSPVRSRAPSTANALSLSLAAAAPPAPLPVKEQLAIMAQRTKPVYTIQAHDDVVSTLHLSSSPPALLSSCGSHLCHVWSLDGECLGLLDPVAGLARGYELSSPGGSTGGGGASGAKEQPWNFKIDVEARAAKDRSVTQQVMTTLQDMAKQKASRQAQLMQMRQQQQLQQQQQQMQQQQQQQQLADKSEAQSLAASARDRSAPVSTRGAPSE